MCMLENEHTLRYSKKRVRESCVVGMEALSLVPQGVTSVTIRMVLDY